MCYKVCGLFNYLKSKVFMHNQKVHWDYKTCFSYHLIHSDSMYIYTKALTRILNLGKRKQQKMLLLYECKITQYWQQNKGNEVEY